MATRKKVLNPRIEAVSAGVARIAKKAEKPILETYRRCDIIRRELLELGAGTLSVLEMPNGSLMEYWTLPGGRVVLLIGNPNGWDLFRPFTGDNNINYCVNKLRAYAKDRKAE